MPKQLPDAGHKEWAAWLWTGIIALLVGLVISIVSATFFSRPENDLSSLEVVPASVQVVGIIAAGLLAFVLPLRRFVIMRFAGAGIAMLSTLILMVSGCLDWW